ADKFYHASDFDLNYHPARKVVYFDNKSYFISLNDAAFYEIGTQFIDYNYNLDEHTRGEEIPRIRICSTYRKSGGDRFRVGRFSFVLEQGIDENYVIDTGSGLFCNGLLITEDSQFFIVTE